MRLCSIDDEHYFPALNAEVLQFRAQTFLAAEAHVIYPLTSHKDTANVHVLALHLNLLTTKDSLDLLNSASLRFFTAISFSIRVDIFVVFCRPDALRLPQAFAMIMPWNRMLFKRSSDPLDCAKDR